MSRHLCADVPDSSTILRAHTPLSNLLSCLWFNEVVRYSHRDQFSFGYVRDQILKRAPGWRINMFAEAERRNFVQIFTHAAIIKQTESAPEEQVIDKTRGEFLSKAHIMFSEGTG